MTVSPAVPGYQTLLVRIDHESAVGYASAVARERATALGLAPGMTERAAVVASELASNVHKHARGGVVLLGPAAPRAGLQVWAVDRGPGMADFERCLADGYSSTNTLGAGLGAARRMATDFAVWSRPGVGTVVSARFHSGQAGTTALPGIDVAAFCLAAHNTGAPGDAYALTETPSGATLLVVDGLGHGPEAATAATVAVAAFRDRAEQPLPTLLEHLHQALRGTRGAAAAVFRVHADRIDSCGVGNVGGLVLSAGRPGGRMIGQPGTLGVRIPGLQVRPHPLRSGDTLVVHTDGITNQWWKRADGEVLYQPPGTLLGFLAGSHRRHHDDATAVALRPTRLRHAVH